MAERSQALFRLFVAVFSGSPIQQCVAPSLKVTLPFRPCRFGCDIQATEHNIAAVKTIFPNTKMKPWHYAFAERDLLRDIGIKQATPVRYDPTTGIIEMLDHADSSEWMIPSADASDDEWADIVKKCFHIHTIFMDVSLIDEFNDKYLRVNAIGQRLLFTEAMEYDFERLMFAILLF